MCTVSAQGQWYVKKYNVSDIDYLTREQLEESIQSSKVGAYASLGVMGIGGLVVLIESFFPYSMEDDDNVTFFEELLGEKGIHKVNIAAGVGISAGGAIASIVFLERFGTLKSVLKRNFPVSGSLNLSPALIMERTTHSLYPGVTVTFNF